MVACVAPDVLGPFCTSFAGGARESGVHAWEALLGKASPEFNCVDTAADDPALIIYTSGTTGAPKGAYEAHRLLIGNLSGFVHSHDFFPQPGDMFWSPADWAWAGGLFDALLPSWACGIPILGYRGKFDAEKAYYLLEKYGVRNSFLFPTALKLMMKAYPRPREAFDIRLRSIMSAGEAVGTTVFEWARDALGVTINEMFGQTEMNYIVGNSHGSWPAKPGSMGRPYPGHRIAIVDDEGHEQPAGEAGEVAVHRVAPDGSPDPVFFLEYFGNPEGTRNKFTGDWCRTGDIGFVDANGYLHISGRKKNMVKSGGISVFPEEIEDTLKKHPDVTDAAVVGFESAEWGEAVKAFVVLNPDAACSADALIRFCKKSLAPYKAPKVVEFLSVLPRTGLGKIDREKLGSRAEDLTVGKTS